MIGIQDTNYAMKRENSVTGKNVVVDRVRTCT